MDKSKAKEKIKYVEKLDGEHRCRYLDKLRSVNGFDPYDSIGTAWSSDLNLLPPLAFGDIVTYVVCGRSAYSLQEFKSYKSLESHMQFTSTGCALHVHLNINSVSHCVVLGEFRSQTGFFFVFFVIILFC